MLSKLRDLVWCGLYTSYTLNNCLQASNHVTVELTRVYRVQ
jgi:hypothetical protein